jgi:hypothetical protein
LTHDLSSSIGMNHASVPPGKRTASAESDFSTMGNRFLAVKGSVDF